MTRFELVIVGDLPAGYRRYRRWHHTFDGAKEAASELLHRLDTSGDPAISRAAHPAIVYGPGCGRDGITVS